MAAVDAGTPTCGQCNYYDGDRATSGVCRRYPPPGLDGVWPGIAFDAGGCAEGRWKGVDVGVVDDDKQIYEEITYDNFVDLGKVGVAADKGDAQGQEG